MPRIIFKCPYIKPGTKKAAAHLNNYVRYEVNKRKKRNRETER